jgi:hypothetical protein
VMIVTVIVPALLAQRFQETGHHVSPFAGILPLLG